MDKYTILPHKCIVYLLEFVITEINHSQCIDDISTNTWLSNKDKHAGAGI